MYNLFLTGFFVTRRIYLDLSLWRMTKINILSFTRPQICMTFIISWNKKGELLHTMQGDLRAFKCVTVH